MVENQVRKNIVNRLRTIKGHIQGVENMIEEGKSCEEILLQIAAIKSSVEKVGHIIIEDYTKTCLLGDEIDKDKIEQVFKIITKFMK